MEEYLSQRECVGHHKEEKLYLRRKSIDFDTNKLEGKGSWLNSDEQRHGRNLFGPQMLHQSEDGTEPSVLCMTHEWGPLPKEVHSCM